MRESETADRETDEARSDTRRSRDALPASLLVDAGSDTRRPADGLAARICLSETASAASQQGADSSSPLAAHTPVQPTALLRCCAERSAGPAHIPVMTRM